MSILTANQLNEANTQANWRQCAGALRKLIKHLDICFEQQAILIEFQNIQPNSRPNYLIEMAFGKWLK